MTILKGKSATSGYKNVAVNDEGHIIFEDGDGELGAINTKFADATAYIQALKPIITGNYAEGDIADGVITLSATADGIKVINRSGSNTLSVTVNSITVVFDAKADGAYYSDELMFDQFDTITIAGTSPDFDIYSLEYVTREEAPENV